MIDAVKLFIEWKEARRGEGPGNPLALLADRTQTGQLSRNRNQVEAKKSSPGGKFPLLSCGVCGNALCSVVVDFRCRLR